MNTELKTAAAYIRVSTDNQTELSPDSQLKVVRDYAKQHGFIIPREFVFRDDGISGRYADKRPQFNSMIAVAKQKPSPFSAVLLWKFSRFARNQEESIFYKSMLRKNGIEVLSVSEPMVDGPFGTLIERIIEWSDEYYSIRLSGEVKRGMTEKVERGGAVSVPAFGYGIENKKYIINPETAPFVQKIFNDYLSGIPMLKIAQNLNNLKIKTTRGNLWENRTIEYILRNPVYIGKIRWNPKRKTLRNYDDPDIMIIDGEHEAIIDEEMFNQVQNLLDTNKKKHQPKTHSVIKEDYMLHGLVKCSNCGSSLVMSVKGVSLQCVSYVHGKCNVSHSISIKKINAMVIEALENTFSTGIFNLSVKNTQGICKNTEIDIDKIIERENQKLKRVKEAYEDGVYTLEEYKESKNSILANIEEFKKQVSKPKNDEEKNSRQLIEKCKNVITQLKNDDVSEADKNNILKEFVDKIVFNRTNTSLELFLYI